jgi:hypothetical protein
MFGMFFFSLNEVAGVVARLSNNAKRIWSAALTNWDGASRF